nr:CoA transferase [Bradyrhizobium sp.]
MVQRLIAAASAAIAPSGQKALATLRARLDNFTGETSGALPRRGIGFAGEMPLSMIWRAFRPQNRYPLVGKPPFFPSSTEKQQRENNVLDKSAPQSSTRASGPLAGFRIVEFAGIGPGPFACMMLADMGAEVVTLDRVGARKNLKSVAGRGRKVVELDLKSKDAIAQVLDLLSHADALIEGFRPGVMERL